MKLRILHLLLGLLFTTSLHAASEAPARALIVIGYNGGPPDSRKPLSFADDDAARLFGALAPTSTKAWLLTTFDKESARTFPDLSDVARAPTRDALAGALGEAFWLLRQEKAKGRETELVFAFAGHGDVDDGGMGFVVLQDGTFTRDDLLHQVLEPSPADVNHVVVDACSSYFFVEARGGNAAGSQGVALTPKLLDVLKHPMSEAVRARTGVLVSTSQAAEVHESRALNAGVFSFLLRSALTGVADVNHDGRVEYAEAAAFIMGASGEVEDPRARLSIHAEAPLQRPHSALVDLRQQGDRFLAIDEARGHLRVFDPRGVPYAEVNVRGDAAAPVYMALNAEPFFIVQRDDEEALLVPRAAGGYALSALTFEKKRDAQTRGMSDTFSRLFARTYDAQFVGGVLAGSELPAPVRGDEGTRFALAWAKQPPLRIPVNLVGGGAVVGAIIIGGVAAGALVGNNLAFQALQAKFAQTGALDPKLSLDVEGWRQVTTGLTFGAAAVGAVGVGLLVWSFSLEDGKVALP
jgi:hypothetical protein